MTSKKKESNLIRYKSKYNQGENRPKYNKNWVGAIKNYLGFLGICASLWLIGWISRLFHIDESMMP